MFPGLARRPPELHIPAGSPRALPQLSPLAAVPPAPPSWGPRVPPPGLARRLRGSTNHPTCLGILPLGQSRSGGGPAPHRNDKGLAPLPDRATVRAPPRAWGTRASLSRLAQLTRGPRPPIWLRIPETRPRLGVGATGASPLGGRACCPGPLLSPVSALAPLPGGGALPSSAHYPRTTLGPETQPPTCPSGRSGPAHCLLGPKL